MGGLGPEEFILVLGELLGDFAVTIILNNLGAVSNEQLRVNQAINIVPDRLQGC